MSRVVKLVVPGVLVLGLVACAAGGRRAGSPAARAAATPPVTTSLAGGCRQVATRELADVARRISVQATRGLGVATAVRRLERSRALAAAVAGGSRARVRSVFLPLRHQIVRIEIFDRTHRLYSFGTSPSFAPVRGRLRDAGGKVVGRFVLAETNRRAYAGILKRLTGADVVFRSAGRAARRPGFRVVSLAMRAYPSGPLHLDVQIPVPSSTLCGTDNADTRLNTIGYVGRRLLQSEAASRAVNQTLRHVARDPVFRRATARDDPRAIRAAIIREFFRNHSFHIVRVRVTRGPRLVYDLGGPYALQPATGTVRSPDGRTSATFMLAVQDDTGYIKLMHRFTGADVQLVSPLGRVPGSSLAPGPARIPEHGPVTYRGRHYLADSFTGTAFPSGVLRVSVLVPAGR